MAKGDRRNSNKMKQRRAQAQKKRRLARRARGGDAAATKAQPSKGGKKATKSEARADVESPDATSTND